MAVIVNVLKFFLTFLMLSTLTACTGLPENYKYSGKILLNNKDIKTIKNENLAKLISYVPQNFFVNNDFTLKDYVYFGRYPFAENRFNFSIVGVISLSALALQKLKQFLYEIRFLTNILRYSRNEL